MDQRTQFIADYLRESLSTTDLCALYGVSRKTGYKWIDRYLRHGPTGLDERSCKPRASPNQTDQEIVTAILEIRRRHPSWGAKKLLVLLHKGHPRWDLPGRSTVCDILSRHGLVPKQRQRRRIGHPGKPTSTILAPNDLWCADYKGQFKTGNGLYCYPLTVTDGYSRYLLSCQALDSTAVAGAKPVFTRLFKEYGLPTRIRTDNGVPFATTTLARLSALSAWWVRLGVMPELIEPGKPQQNGRHERMHRTLKDETTRPAAGSLSAQQRKFNHFRDEFNNERPHEALDQQTPASQYQPSLREMPNKIPPLEYPDRFEVRYVSANGGIRWNRDWVNVSSVCIGEYVGFEEIDDGIWNVYFGPLKLGRFDERHMRIEDQYGKLKRRNL
ncbi:MAG: IS481 family transposase [Candidatus Binatus sp.]|uniref:IS481 family transposase n=1 Tax=Candidatus Binatus sp. TaxID=2811406 RepID=UPI0027255EFC|nr:IS481 family transposase [Candidatus Binatus sp.]MDO8434124.1 IS481 family transposase [Candidatus Binatus sp.]